MSATAAWIAAARARESARPDALFCDPFAAALAGERGLAILARSEAASGAENRFLPIRTRHFDDVLLQAVHAADVRQVVLLGAGFDARAFRLTLPKGTTVFEIDRPEVLAEKARTLADVPPRCVRRTVAADLTACWQPALQAAGFDPKAPAVWLAEGLLYYLSEPSVRALLCDAASLSTRGSRFLADVFGTGLRGLPATRTSAFCTDDPAGLFTAAGWTPSRVSWPGAPVASYGRLPTRDLPPSADLTLRAYLLTAIR